MAQSPEFPELRWMPPRAWNAGRAAGQPTVVVIHSTEGSEGTHSAEDGAAYDQRRTDGTSTHFFVDADSVIQCVKTTDRANHARATGNKIGVGFELCGRAGQTSAQWHDAASLPMLRLAAKYVAKVCRKYSIPVRRLSVAQLRAGGKGICGHVDITDAFGESTHTDPGPNFPWAEFLSMVAAELKGDDMTPEQATSLAHTEKMVGSMYAEVRAALAGLRAQVGAIAAEVNIDPVELAAVADAARQASEAGTAAALQESVDDWADRIAAKVPSASRDELVAAVREVFADAGEANVG